MSPNGFLYMAYTVAWVVYLGYMVRIFVRMKRVEDETKELQGSRR